MQSQQPSALQQAMLAISHFLGGTYGTNRPTPTLQNVLGTGNYSFMKASQQNNQPPQVAGVASNVTQQGTRPQLTPDLVKAAILRWSNGNANVPALQYTEQLAQAGNMMPQHIDPWLPVFLALRETQGGRDLANRSFGQNNMFNIRSGPGQFQDYSSIPTAILGGTDQSGQHAGMVGLINHSIPAQTDYYKDFRNTGNMSDFFSHWSPQGDGNGSVPAQVQNYGWIKNKMLGPTVSQGQGDAYDTNKIPQTNTNSFSLANANQ